MKSRLARFIMIALSLASPMWMERTAKADDLVNDARIEAYGGKNVLESGAAPYYLLLAALGVLCCSVMFKDAKRADATK
jgi:hypothetical protein